MRPLNGGTKPEDAEETNGNESGRVPVDRKLLELLVCPLTKTRLTYEPETAELVSEAARLAYPIRGGVPIMLVSEARELDID